jgi:hypothetical protein
MNANFLKPTAKRMFALFVLLLSVSSSVPHSYKGRSPILITIY